MNSTRVQMIRWAAALGSPLALTFCSIDPNAGKRGSDFFDRDTGPGDGMGASSLTAFEKTVYPLVRSQTCVNCHSPTSAAKQTPFFAADSVEDSHTAIIEGQKVDFNEPLNSRLVVRLSKDSHNCWDNDCPKSAAEMHAKIEEWIALMADTNGTSELGIVTEGLYLADAQEKDGGDDSETPMVEAELGTLRPPMRVENDAAASGGKYIVVPNGNSAQALQANAANGGRSVHTIEIPEAGIYFLFGLVGAPAAADNSFFVRMDNVGQFLQWRTDITGNNFAWDLASDQDAGGNILQFLLTPGTHTLEIRQREDGLKLDVIALTTDMNFAGGEGGTKRKALRFDISSLVESSGTYFEIEAGSFDAVSYVFKNPTIASPTAKLKVKNVRVLINGLFDPQNADFTLIDQEVSPPGAMLSGAAMIVPKAKGDDGDLISIAFEILEISN